MNIWGKNEFKALTDKEKLLYIYLQDKGHYSGIFILPSEQKVNEDTGVTGIEEAVKGMMAKKLLAFDEQTKVVWIEKQNPVSVSETQRKGILSHLFSLPPSFLTYIFLRANSYTLRAFCDNIIDDIEKDLKDKDSVVFFKSLKNKKYFLSFAEKNKEKFIFKDGENPELIGFFVYLSLYLFSKKMDTPIDTPMDTPIDTPIDTPMDTPIDTPMNTPMNTPMDTPIDTPMIPLWIPLSDDFSHIMNCSGVEPTYSSERMRTVWRRLISLIPSSPKTLGETIQKLFYISILKNIYILKKNIFRLKENISKSKKYLSDNFDSTDEKIKKNLLHSRNFLQNCVLDSFSPLNKAIEENNIGLKEKFSPLTAQEKNLRETLLHLDKQMDEIINSSRNPSPSLSTPPSPPSSPSLQAQKQAQATTKQATNGNSSAVSERKKNGWAIWVDVHRDLERKDPVPTGRDTKMIKQVWEALKEDEQLAKKVFKAFLTEKDKFIVSRGYSPADLYSRLNKYITLPAGYEEDLYDNYVLSDEQIQDILESEARYARLGIAGYEKKGEENATTPTEAKR